MKPLTIKTSEGGKSIWSFTHQVGTKTDPTAIVSGCAGSGKTTVILDNNTLLLYYISLSIYNKKTSLYFVKILSNCMQHILVSIPITHQFFRMRPFNSILTSVLVNTSQPSTPSLITRENSAPLWRDDGSRYASFKAIIPL